MEGVGRRDKVRQSVIRYGLSIMETSVQTLGMHYLQHLSLYLAVRCGYAHRPKVSVFFFFYHTCLWYAHIPDMRRSRANTKVSIKKIFPHFGHTFRSFQTCLAKYLAQI